MMVKNRIITFGSIKVEIDLIVIKTPWEIKNLKVENY